MKFKPRTAAVMGAGTMGAPIAGYLADLGIKVFLFDQPGKAVVAHENLVKNNFCSPTSKKRVIPLDSVPENHHLLGECDLIVEVVFEKFETKVEVNAIIAAHKKPDAVVVTNTSGISINALAEKAGPEFARRFFVGHFFNPVKDMALLEVCMAEGGDAETYQAFCEWARFTLGKALVQVRDTPNFVGNRTGAGLMVFVFHLMEGLDINIADVEEIMRALFGWRPFDTWDQVGLGLAHDVANNVFSRDQSDPLHHWWNPEIPWIQSLIAKGFVGRKGPTQSGFLAQGPKKAKLAFDFNTGEYVPYQPTGYPTLTAAMGFKKPEQVGDRLTALLTSDSSDPDVLFARKVFAVMAAYSAAMVGKICDDPKDIDDALQLGFNWPVGIFRLVDVFGVPKTLALIESQGYGHLVPGWFTVMGREGKSFYGPDTYMSVSKHNAFEPIPRVEGGVYLDDMAKDPKLVVHASDDMLVLDASNPRGRAALAVITSPNSTIGHGVLDGLSLAMDWCEQGDGAALVVTSNGPNLGAGANLKYMLAAIDAGDWTGIEGLIRKGQDVFNRLEYSGFPTVAVPHGFTLGGSCELAMACNCRVADNNAIMGQTELEVGVITGWGGLMRPLRTMMAGLNPHFLWSGHYTVPTSLRLIHWIWDMYSWAKRSRNAVHARDMGFLRQGDVIVPAQGTGAPYVLRRALEVAQGMLLAGFQPPTPFVFNLPGKSGSTRLKMVAERGLKTGSYPVPFPGHNTLCASLAAEVLCGGDTWLHDEVSEAQILDLEREAFMQVIRRPEARAYIDALVNRKK